MIDIKDEIKVKIHSLIKDWAHDYASEPVYYKKDENGITFSSIENNYDGPWNLSTMELEKELVNEGIDYMLKEFGYVYVYICKDNRIVSIEWACANMNINEFKEQVEQCDEVIEGKYYEGWD